MAGLGELLVVASHVQRTGAGRSLSDAVVRGWPSKQHVGGQPRTFFAVEGTPAQAVRWGIMAKAARRPALVLSGINYSENLASDLPSSGTVGAAMEAATCGIPGLAISLEVMSRNHYSGPDACHLASFGQRTQRGAHIGHDGQRAQKVANARASLASWPVRCII